VTTIELAAKGAAARRTDGLARLTRVLCVLFFFSGFPALIYQLSWQRALFRIFGVNIESVTIVVTAFMLGLGLGSLAGGFLSKRRDIPLLPLLAAIEFATAAFGVVSLRIFDGVGALVVGLPLAETAAASLLVVLIPTLLMGATLPVLVGHLVRRSGQVGSALGLLYYVNTLGAGAACLVCAVLLFPFVGMQGSVYVAVGINAAVATGALIIYWREHGAAIGKTPAALVAPGPSATQQPVLALSPVLVLAAAGGFVSLSYEIFFLHTVSYATGSSATAFATTFGAFLIGLASGSRRAGRNCAAVSGGRALRRATADLMWASLIGVCFLPLLASLAWLDRGIIGVAFVLVYLFARFWGSLLPHLAEFGIAADDRAGMRTALLYLANILGSAAGSILTGFVLADHLGIVGMAAALTVASLACALALNGMLPSPRTQKMLQASMAAGLAVLTLVAIPYWPINVLEELQWKGAADAKPLVHIVENRSGIISVTADGMVLGNGMYDGRFNTDLKHDTNGIVRPYALSLFHVAPRDVLLIGLSSGSWAQVIANNPEVASLTVVEINPGYLTLIGHEPQVASLLSNPKVSIVIDDGRRWLRANPGRRFDAVVSNTTFHFRANATNLLTAEFVDLVKGHLKDGGVFFYNTTDSARVQRTGCLGFTEGARFYNHLVVSEKPIRWDFTGWRRTLEAYRTDGRPVFDVSRSQDRAQLDLLMGLEASLTSRDALRPIELCRDILARTAGKAPVTDDNVGSEWRYSLGLE
jgi:spermidine synthase